MRRIAVVVGLCALLLPIAAWADAVNLTNQFGTVSISSSGIIENLHVVSGPAMLQQAALDAVKTWRYRPYLLNGQPVEVETTVNVIFALGG